MSLSPQGQSLSLSLNQSEQGPSLLGVSPSPLDQSPSASSVDHSLNPTKVSPDLNPD